MFFFPKETFITTVRHETPTYTIYNILIQFTYIIYLSMSMVKSGTLSLSSQQDKHKNIEFSAHKDF
jgi:hypothetical protein